jgi:hypothetical protein
MRRRIATLHAGASSLAQAVQAVQASNAHSPADGSIELAAFTVMGGLLESMLAWVDGALHMPRAQLLEQIIDISVAAMEYALRERLVARTHSVGV